MLDKRNKIFLVMLFCLLQITFIYSISLEKSQVLSAYQKIHKSIEEPMPIKDITIDNSQTFILNIDDKVDKILMNFDQKLNGPTYILYFNLFTDVDVISEINNIIKGNQNIGYKEAEAGYIVFFEPSNKVEKYISKNFTGELKINVDPSMVEPFVILLLKKKEDSIIISYATIYNLDKNAQKEVFECELNNKIINFFCSANNPVCKNLRKSCLIPFDLDLEKLETDKFVEEIIEPKPKVTTKTYNYEVIRSNNANDCDIKNYPIVENGLNYRCVCVRWSNKNYYGVEKCNNKKTVVYGPWSPYWDPLNIKYEWSVEFPGTLTKPCWRGEISGCNETDTWSIDLVD